jgi:hypothetical protein
MPNRARKQVGPEAYLIAQLILHVLLDPPEHERLENHVQPPQLMLVKVVLVTRLRSGVLDVPREPLRELVVRVEEGRHDEVEESPEFCITSKIRERGKKGSVSFPMRVEKRSKNALEGRGRTMHRILNGRSGEEKSVSTVEAEEGLPSGGRRALDRLSFVEDHVLPLDPLKVLFIRYDLGTEIHQHQNDSRWIFEPRPEGRQRRTGETHQLITRNQHMERRISIVADLLPIPELPQRRPILRVAPVGQALELGDEFGDLLLPVVERRGGSDDEEGTPDVVDLGKVSHEGDRLDRLSYHTNNRNVRTRSA